MPEKLDTAKRKLSSDDQRGYTLQTVIIVSTVTLAAVGLLAVLSGAVSDIFRNSRETVDPGNAPEIQLGNSDPGANPGEPGVLLPGGTPTDVIPILDREGNPIVGGDPEQPGGIGIVPPGGLPEDETPEDEEDENGDDPDEEDDPDGENNDGNENGDGGDGDDPNDGDDENSDENPDDEDDTDGDNPDDDSDNSDDPDNPDDDPNDEDGDEAGDENGDEGNDGDEGNGDDPDEEGDPDADDPDDDSDNPDDDPNDEDGDENGDEEDGEFFPEDPDADDSDPASPPLSPVCELELRNPDPLHSNPYCPKPPKTEELAPQPVVIPPRLPDRVLGNSPREVAGRYNHNCSVNGDGSVSCWGSNSFGQLGNNSPDSNFVTWKVVIDHQVGTTLKAEQVETGRRHTCARFDRAIPSLTGNGGVSCWGDNKVGQLGTGLRRDYKGPAGVQLPSSVLEISLGEDHSCALLYPSYNVYCWGSQHESWSNPGNTPTPTKIDLGGLALQISAGAKFTCALLADTTVRCWGSNSHGQLGGGTAGGRGSSLVLGSDGEPLKGFSRISAGDNHVCGVVNGLRCWGANSRGQSSGETRGNPIIIPSPIYGHAKFNFNDYRITAGPQHTCAHREYQVHCWGDINLGNGAIKPPGSDTLQFSYTNGLENQGATFTDLFSVRDTSCTASIDNRILCWGNTKDFRLD